MIPEAQGHRLRSGFIPVVRQMRNGINMHIRILWLSAHDSVSFRQVTIWQDW
jgi:hypothetical protein